MNLSNLRYFARIVEASITPVSFHSHSCLIDDSGVAKKEQISRFIEGMRAVT